MKKIILSLFAVALLGASCGKQQNKNVAETIIDNAMSVQAEDWDDLEDVVDDMYDALEEVSEDDVQKAAKAAKKSLEAAKKAAEALDKLDDDDVNAALDAYGKMLDAMGGF